MCFDPNEATIKGNTTVAQDNAAGAQNTAAQYVAKEQDPSGMAGLKEPDITDSLLEEARKRMALQLVQRSSRREALANNQFGGAPVSYSLLSR